MAVIKLTRPRGLDRGLVLADGVEVGAWRLRRWVIGRSNLYTASLDGGATVSDTTLSGLRRKFERQLLQTPANSINPEALCPKRDNTGRPRGCNRTPHFFMPANALSRPTKGGAGRPLLK